MAKPSWLTTDPNSGSGNGSISNTATTHTGREVRTGTVTVTAAGVAEPKTYSVTQKAKPEFVSFDDGVEMSAPKAGGPVTVLGKSNSAALTYTWVGDVSDVELPAQYKANGAATNNGAAISGDPGATAEYATSIELTLPANETIEEVSRVIKVTAQGGQEAQITIKQAAGDAFLNVTPASITLEADGKQTRLILQNAHNLHGERDRLGPALQRGRRPFTGQRPGKHGRRFGPARSQGNVKRRPGGKRLLLRLKPQK